MQTQQANKQQTKQMLTNNNVKHKPTKRNMLNNKQIRNEAGKQADKHITKLVINQTNTDKQ